MADNILIAKVFKTFSIKGRQYFQALAINDNKVPATIYCFSSLKKIDDNYILTLNSTGNLFESYGIFSYIDTSKRAKAILNNYRLDLKGKKVINTFFKPQVIEEIEKIKTTNQFNYFEVLSFLQSDDGLKAYPEIYQIVNSAFKTKETSFKIKLAFENLLDLTTIVKLLKNLEENIENLSISYMHNYTYQLKVKTSLSFKEISKRIKELTREFKLNIFR